MAKTRRGIYMDYASSYAPNPGSIHELGVIQKKKLENARNEVAKVLGAHRDEVIFTASGTEANNLAILGSVKRGHIVTTNIEHPSVLETCEFLQKNGVRVTFVAVEQNGIVDPKKIKEALRGDTALVSIMYANNELGTIEPIREIAKIIRHYNKHNKKNILFHTDAVQAAKYLDLSMERLGVDMLTLSGSKLRDGIGVGVLCKKRGVKIENIIKGGGQELGLRPGTENVPAIVKFSRSLSLAQKEKEKELARLLKIKNYFVQKLSQTYGFGKTGFILNGDLNVSLPNIVNITVPKIPSDLLVLELSSRGVYVSEKSACKAGEAGDSHVIQALRIHDTNSLRFSFGRSTTKGDIDYTLKSLSLILKKLKRWYN